MSPFFCLSCFLIILMVSIFTTNTLMCLLLDHHFPWKAKAVKYKHTFKLIIIS